MKTKAILLLLSVGLMGISTKLFAQKDLNAYYTTLNLKEIIRRYDPVTKKIGVFIDKEETKGKRDFTDATLNQGVEVDLIKKFIENPLDTTVDFTGIAKKVNDFYEVTLKTKQKAVNGAQGNVFGNLATKTVGFQSILIDGTAKYIADRFKEEATILYINKFREVLKDKPFTDFKYLTPKTYTYLQRGDLFKFKDILGEVRENFEADLDNVLIGLRDLVAEGELTKTFREDTTDKARVAIYRAVFFSLDLGQQLKEKQSFNDIINYLDLSYKNKGGFRNYYTLTHSINILQENLRRKEESTGEIFEFKNYWLKSTDLAKLENFKDYEYFLSFIFNDNKDFISGIFKSLVKGKKDDSELFKKYIVKIASVYQTVDGIRANQQIHAISYVELFSQITDLLELINDKGKFLEQKHIDIAKYSVDIAKTILKKNYASIVPAGSKLLEQILNDNTATEKKDKVVILAKFEKYGTFMVDIVSAQNSDEIKDVISKNVTDYSYLDKRKNKFSLTLNADPGVVPAVEGLSGPFKAAKFALGITCPIGFDFVWSNKVRDAYNGFSLNVFDIGAAFAFRFNDPKSELPEKITLKQVFSPGIAYRTGFKKTPISLAVGYQYLPSLRSVTSSVITEVKSASRFLARITWDIPLVKFKGTE